MIKNIFFKFFLFNLCGLYLKSAKIFFLRVNDVFF